MKKWKYKLIKAMTVVERLAEYDRHIIKTEAPVVKYSVTLDMVIPPGYDDVPPTVKERLAAKLADGLMESGAVHIEPYQVNIVHTREEARNMRYVATLYICEKE